MICIHHSAAISPQQSFGKIDIEFLHEYRENKLHAIEPAYDGIPPGILRRMGKAVRIGVGAALSLLKHNPPVQGIIVGTAHGGLEDCIKFLNQIVEYEEGMLAPGNFVQSTANAIAAQIGLMTANKSYNTTHVHRGHAFENAMIDTGMLISENPANNYLLGAVDEISSYNFNIDRLDGWYKYQPVSNKEIYLTHSPGSFAGEAAAAFIVNGVEKGAIAKIEAVQIIHTKDPGQVKTEILDFINKNADHAKNIDLLISGENGDSRMTAFYETCESVLGAGTQVGRFKHMTGEFPTASAMAVWIACRILQQQQMPGHMVKKGNRPEKFRRILIYNNFKEVQHSLILVSTV